MNSMHIQVDEPRGRNVVVTFGRRDIRPRSVSVRRKGDTVPVRHDSETSDVSTGRHPSGQSPDSDRDDEHQD